MSVILRRFHSKNKLTFIKLEDKAILCWKKIILFFLCTLNLVQKYSDASQFKKETSVSIFWYYILGLAFSCEIYT